MEFKCKIDTYDMNFSWFCDGGGNNNLLQGSGGERVHLHKEPVRSRYGPEIDWTIGFGNRAHHAYD